MAKQIEIWSDGSCSKNPGPGGWAAVVKMGKHRKEISGAEDDTTNNRMEMLAALKALQLLKESCEITLYSDSEYLCNAFNQNWINRWENNGWETADGATVKNQDLWKLLKEQNDRHEIDWQWVKGHADNEENNRCDELAVQARISLQEASSTEEDSLKRIVSSLKQGRSRIHTAHKLLKDKNLEDIEVDLIAEAKKNLAKVVKQIEALINSNA